jgi:prolipoprotein diacylglyceryltransferase
MMLPYTPGHDYYTPLYLLATLTNVLLLLWEGWRRGFPLRPWLTLVAASSLALILGTKLITHPVGEWSSLLFSSAATDTARSILGGGLAAALVAVALRRWLGLGWAVLDALALPLCAALMVQCVGCVLTGCCFGDPTAAAWGLTYAAGTPPWWAQVQAGLLPATAVHSLPVAPTQVLALLLCAAVGGVLLATRNRRWPVGSWLLLQTGLLLLGRFAQGFWRDAAGEPVACDVHSVLGMRWLELQLWLLPLALLALGLWAWRVRRPVALLYRPDAARPVPVSRYLLGLVGLLGITAALSATALTGPETLVVRGLLLLVLAVEASQLLIMGSTQKGRQSTTCSLRFLRLLPLPRLLPVGLAAGVFVLTSQSPAPPDSTAVGRVVISLDAQQSDYTDIVSTSGCGSPPRTVAEYEHFARVAGGEVRYNLPQISGSRSVSVGVGSWVGNEQISITSFGSGGPAGLAKQPAVPLPLHAISPFVEFSSARPHHFGGGLRLGVNLGKLGYRLPTEYDTTLTTLRVGPQIAWWLGVREKVYVQSDLGLGSNSLGHYLLRFGVGSGLGRRSGRFVLAGIAGPTSLRLNFLGTEQPELPSPMGFISGQVQLPNTPISLEPTLLSDFGRNYQVNLRVSLQLPTGRR